MKKRFFVYVTIFSLSIFFISSHSLRSAETYTPPKEGGPPNELGIVQQVAKDHPDWLADMYNGSDNPTGTWEFLDEAVKQLHAKDPHWVYNGKRGDPKNPSSDVVAYYYGPGEAPTANTINMFEVYLVDIMTYGQVVHWNDITLYGPTPCVYGSYLYPRNSPAGVPELPETPPSCDTPAPPEQPPAPVPPDLPIGGVTALSGKNPSLAFNPTNSLWLVVAENGGKIQGQFMTNVNKPSGSLLNIGGSDAHTPKIAYAPSINKYLVVWTSGKDPNSVLWGQLLSDTGSASGPAIKIGAGGARLYSTGNLQYDSLKQSFVFAYEKAGNGTDVMIVGVSGSGAITGPTKLADVSLISSAPSVAINTGTNEYCATYMDGNKIKIQSISSSGTAGTVTDLAQGNGNAGITYNSTSNNYTVAWLSKDGDIVSKIISTCADDPEQDIFLLTQNTKTGILVQNLNGFGLFAINSTNANDHFSWFDSSSNQAGDQTIFGGTWNPDGSWLSAGSNTLTNMYAVAASPDAKTVKFVSGIGTPSSAPPNNGPFPPQPVLPVPDKGLPNDLGQLISTIFVWSLGIIGLVIFVRFFYAGFLWFTAAGNASNVGNAKGIMKNAVYGALVLFSAWLILNTINPDLVGGTFNLPGLPAGTGGTGSGACADTASLARQYNEPSSAQNDPKLTALISCIKSKLPAGTALGEESTFDKSHPLCNYTRGNPVCETCSHTVNSCHYGGKAGTQGALAVDFGEEKSGDKIIQAAVSCGVPPVKARCENASGNKVACSDASATHIHISETSCDGN